MELLSADTMFAFWLTLGLTLIVGEMLVLNGYLLVAGLGFLVTGLVHHFFGFDLAGQLITLTGALVILFVGLRKLSPYYFAKDAAYSALNDRESQMVGKTYSLYSGIENGRGQIQVGDSLYSVEGPNLPQGALVVITSRTDTAFQVTPTQAETSA